MSVQPLPPQTGSDPPPALTGPLTVGDLLDRAFRLYRSRFGLFLLTGAVLLVPIAIAAAIFLQRFFASYRQTFAALMREPPGTELFPFAAFSGLLGDLTDVILVSLLIAAAGAIVSLSLTAQAVEALRGRSLPLMAGLRRGLRRFLPYVGMVIVQYAAIAAAAVVVLAPLVLFGVALVVAAPSAPAGEGGIFSALAAAGLAICGYGLAFILMLAPIVYLSARWLVAPAILVAERTGPIDAMRRSWRLSQDNVLRMVGYLVLFYILQTIFISVPLVALQYAAMLLLPSSAGAIDLMMSLPTALSPLISVIGLPFFVAVVVLLYYDLRIRGNGYALKS